MCNLTVSIGPRASSTSQAKRRAVKRATCPRINHQILSAVNRGGVAQLLLTIEENLLQMNLVNISTAFHRLAKVAANDIDCCITLFRHSVIRDLVATANLALLRHKSSVPPCQALSNIIWSLASIQLNDLPLLRTVSLLATTHMAKFKPFELSSVLWALATLGSCEESRGVCASVFEAAASTIAEELDEFSFRCRVMVCWAFAQAKQRASSLFNEMVPGFLGGLSAASCQELASIAWAYGSMDCSKDLLEQLAERALQFDVIEPQDLSNILWGLAVSGVFNTLLFERAVAEVRNIRLPEQISQLSCALSLWQPLRPSTQEALAMLRSQLALEPHAAMSAVVCGVEIPDVALKSARLGKAHVSGSLAFAFGDVSEPEYQRFEREFGQALCVRELVKCAEAEVLSGICAGDFFTERPRRETAARNEAEPVWLVLGAGGHVETRVSHSVTCR